ncbi:MAG: glycosyl hydrolase family 28-related protein, partial [Pseudomonadota bacterium]
MAGANLTVDGIIDRPTYHYEPPASFFAEGEPTGPDVFNILDFGAVADPTVDSTPMIQAAIDAAHAAGGGVVYVPPGIFGVTAADGHNGAVLLQSNVFLKGAGMGESTFRVMDGNDQKITGVVRSPFGEATVNYGAADLTIDGNRENGVDGAKVDGFFSGGRPGDTIADEDVYLLRVEIQNSSGYGFDPHEQTHRLLIQDSVAHDNGLDGFVADFLVDSHYTGNVAYDNDRHGFNIVTSTNDFLMTD